MSDEDILAMGEPPIQETSNYPEGEANEPDEGEPQGEPEDEADVSNEPEGDSENPESEVPSTKEEGNAEETGEIDYKAVYEKLFKPFKANGKEISVETPEEAIALMQQGANYNKKMASLKPNLKIIKMLEKNGLLDESKLSYLIDIDKKNPNALRKLFKESDIDLYGYDAEESDEGTYQPTQYSVPDSEMEFDTVVEELQDSPMFSKLVGTLTKEWDESSRQVINTTPEIMKVIHGHMESGIYDIIAKEVDRLNALGRIPANVSSIEAYRQVGDALDAKGAFNHLNTMQVNAPVSQQHPQRQGQSNPQLNQKKRSISPIRQSNKSTSPSDINYLNLSDEEFLKMSLQG